MSILNRIGNDSSGCLNYGWFLLWIGALLGIPALVWDESAINICGIIALCATLYLTVLDQINIPFIKDYPLTFMHLCYVVIYTIALAACLIIDGEDAELFASVIVPMVCLLVSFIIDLIYYKK